jgi:hypothetical protein
MQNMIPVLLGGSWASGINLYMTTAGLGIAQRMHWVDLPGELTVLGHPLIIGAAVLMYGVEFIADKIPFVDSIWDMIHTFIRPTGGAIGGYLATANAEPVIQIATAVLTGGIALSSHVTKASTRAAINSVPTGFGNAAASVTEDTAVFGILYFIVKHPVIASFIAVAVIALTIWVLIKFFRFIKRLFNPVKKGEVVPDVAG